MLQQSFIAATGRCAQFLFLNSHLFLHFACCASLKFQMKLYGADWNCFYEGKICTLDLPRDTSVISTAICSTQQGRCVLGWISGAESLIKLPIDCPCIRQRVVAEHDLDPWVPLFVGCVTTPLKFVYSPEKCNDTNLLRLRIGLVRHLTLGT